MSETKHTPGPWAPYYFRSPRGARQFWAVGSDRVGLMGVAWRVRNKADANLIAAAPDLLDACQFTLGIIEAHLPELYDGSMAQKLRLAIAKAKEQP